MKSKAKKAIKYHKEVALIERNLNKVEHPFYEGPSRSTLEKKLEKKEALEEKYVRLVQEALEESGISLDDPDAIQEATCCEEGYAWVFGDGSWC